MNQEPPAQGQAVLGFFEERCMRAIIIAGGQLGRDLDLDRWVRQGDWIIGADGGAAQAQSRGVIPEVVIGDMDSLSEDARAVLVASGSRFTEHPRAKDETDLELALAFAAEGGADEIVILGALGGRLDHTLANVLLLALPQLAGLTVRIVDGDQDVQLVQSGGTVQVEGGPGDVVSLLPLGGDAHGVRTRGLAWALDRDTLRLGFSRGVSNEMTDSHAQVDIQRGRLLVVHGPPQEEGSVR
jgi:thiamine pyrophosphokinase